MFKTLTLHVQHQHVQCTCMYVQHVLHDLLIKLIRSLLQKSITKVIWFWKRLFLSCQHFLHSLTN